jgi:Glycosyl hydrolases family 31
LLRLEGDMVAQRFPVHWGGDVPPAWEMMLPQLHGGLSLGLSGFSFWSADIGGTGERPADPLTVVVAPFEEDGRTELQVPTGGGEATVRYQARAGRHQVEVAGHPGELVLDAPPGVELRR